MIKVKLGDICTKQSSNYMQKDLDKLEGEYPVYGASGLIKKIDRYHQDKDYIAVVKDGAGIGRTMYLPAESSVIGTLQYLIPNPDKPEKFILYISPLCYSKEKGGFPLCYLRTNTLIKFTASLPVMTA